MVGVPGHPVVYVIHSVGTRHGLQLGHGPMGSYTVLVVGQQSLAHGTVTLDTFMIRGQTWVVGGGAQERVGQVASKGFLVG